MYVRTYFVHSPWRGKATRKGASGPGSELRHDVLEFHAWLVLPALIPRQDKLGVTGLMTDKLTGTLPRPLGLTRCRKPVRSTYSMVDR